MALEYLSFWQMRHPPFEMEGDPHFFFESKMHGEGLARLLYLINDKSMGMAALTGEIGSGKTTLLRVLEDRVRKDIYSIVRIHTSALPFENIIEDINEKLRGAPTPEDAPVDRYHLLKEFEHLLYGNVVNLGKHMVLIMDEAQLLTDECLDSLKCLTNYNQERQSLSVILSGQPELKERLRSMPQVYQRFGMFYHLGRLGYYDILPYLQHRLTIAGAERFDLFHIDCIPPLYEFSRGCPRQINRVCKLAVDRACLLKKDEVDA
ncbi:MAG: AAA family ATPase, partial [Kiritimatiellales bacterium]|nr:AAA family ATPase [Kiritimatiellales bacterium]